MSGDLRALYLLWLVGVQAEELYDDELEPPVPAGLSGSQTALAQFLRLDGNLIAAAAEGSEQALFRPVSTLTPGSRASPRQSAMRC